MRASALIILVLSLCGCVCHSEAEKSLAGVYTQVVPGVTSELTLSPSGEFIWRDSGWNPDRGAWEKERIRGVWSADAMGVHLTCSAPSVPRQLQVISITAGKRVLVGEATFRAGSATFLWTFFPGDRESFASYPDQPAQKKEVDPDGQRTTRGM